MRTLLPTISFEALIGDHGDVATSPGAWSRALKWLRAEEPSKWKTKCINTHSVSKWMHICRGGGPEIDTGDGWRADRAVFGGKSGSSIWRSFIGQTLMGPHAMPGTWLSVGDTGKR